MIEKVITFSETILKCSKDFSKKWHFNNLDISKINDNRSLWKTIVPLFPKKNSKSKKINLTEESRNASGNA